MTLSATATGQALPKVGPEGASAMSLRTAILLVFWILCIPGPASAETARCSGSTQILAVSGQEALEKLILHEEESLTNHLQSADQKAQALGNSGASYGTYMAVLAAVLAGVIALRKVLPALAYPFIPDEPVTSAGPIISRHDAHEEAFSEYLEQVNAKQRPASRNEESKPVERREDPNQLRLLLDNSMVAHVNALDRVMLMRTLFSELSRAVDGEARKEGLRKLLAASVELKKEIRLSEAHPAGRMVSGLEALIGHLISTPEASNAPALRTIAGGIDLLPSLCDPGSRRDLLKDGPLRVLAVDDDAVIRHALAAALKRVGAPPDLASDGQEGLRLAECKAYDVVFVDIEMPGMDGFELCCRIKNTPLNPLTPVVFVTSHNDLATRAKSSLAGGLEFLGKPFNSSELAVKALSVVIKRRLQSHTPPGVVLPMVASNPSKKPAAADVVTRACTPEAELVGAS